MARWYDQVPTQDTAGGFELACRTLHERLDASPGYPIQPHTNQLASCIRVAALCTWIGACARLENNKDREGRDEQWEVSSFCGDRDYAR